MRPGWAPGCGSSEAAPMVGRILAAHRTLARARGGLPRPWQLRALPVCASTERELDQWLRLTPPQTFRAAQDIWGVLAMDAASSAGESAWEPTGDQRLESPRAVLAGHQRFGHGQQGRVWQSPRGGVAERRPALARGSRRRRCPGPGGGGGPGRRAGRAGGAHRPEVAQRSDAAHPGGSPQAGRSAARAAAARRADPLGPHRRGAQWLQSGARRSCCPGGFPRARASRHDLLVARVLLALERAMELARRPEAVRSAAEGLLLPLGPLELEGERWRPQGLAVDGGLRLLNGAGQARVLRRF